MENRTLNERDIELVSLTLELQRVMDDLQRRWEYLCEETGKFGLPPPNFAEELKKRERTEDSEHTELVEVVLRFESLLMKAAGYDLHLHPDTQFREALHQTLSYTQRIKIGKIGIRIPPLSVLEDQFHQAMFGLQAESN